MNRAGRVTSLGCDIFVDSSNSNNVGPLYQDISLFAFLTRLIPNKPLVGINMISFRLNPTSYRRVNTKPLISL